MHPNPAFRQTPRTHNIAFARDRAFGVLTLAGPDGPLAAHIPFVLNDKGTTLEAHLVRSNPILRLLDNPQPALVIVSGPDGYVSPDWYKLSDQVPTWNYIAVHLRGALRRQPPGALPAHAAALSQQFEERLHPKSPWTEAKMDPETLGRMRRMIVPVAIDITQIDGTWKLNQNKSNAARQAAAEAMKTSAVGQEIGALSALMASPPEPE